MDSLQRSRGQVRESTLVEYDTAMGHLIETIGNIDYQGVQHTHGERFIQHWIDAGNARATAGKKLKHLKRMFQLAVERGQLESNPFKYVRHPRVPEQFIHTYSEEECRRMVQVAEESRIGWPVVWDLLIRTALCTGLRRGELLNTTWRDVDFDKHHIAVTPKEDTEHTWKWEIKDTDRRVLPLTKELVRLLAEHQSEQPDGYPYVFVPPFRYDRIQRVRQLGRWNVRKGKCPINNFSRQFGAVLLKAGIDEGEFHDLRRTCITNWFAFGLSEFEVMRLAGHAKFETTRRFYLAVRTDILERARAASTRAMSGISIANPLQLLSDAKNRKGFQS